MHIIPSDIKHLRERSHDNLVNINGFFVKCYIQNKKVERINKTNGTNDEQKKAVTENHHAYDSYDKRAFEKGDLTILDFVSLIRLLRFQIIFPVLVVGYS